MKIVLIGKWIPYGDEFLWNDEIDEQDQVYWYRKPIRFWQVLRDIGEFKSASEASRANFPEYSPDGWQEYKGKYQGIDVLTWSESFVPFLWRSLNSNLLKSIKYRHRFPTWEDIWFRIDMFFTITLHCFFKGHSWSRNWVLWDGQNTQRCSRCGEKIKE